MKFYKELLIDRFYQDPLYVGQGENGSLLFALPLYAGIAVSER